MIFLKLKIDNFYMFKDTEFDFTYPKKIKNSTIENEFLIDFPKIHYKKVCILMGANASGKTSLGDVMCSINNYLCGNSLKEVKKTIFDKEKNASVEVVYITPDTETIHKLIVNFNTTGVTGEIYHNCKLKKSKNLTDTLLEVGLDKNQKFIYNKHNKHNIENPGFQSVACLTGQKLTGNFNAWHYLFTKFNNSTDINASIDCSLLEKILQSFDASIAEIAEIPESDNSYIIKFTNKNSVIVENNAISNPDRLSRGTIEAIEITNLIHSILISDNGTFFLDEKMAYSHSEMEIALLNLMIEKLKENSQLFYTSHNYDVLEMSLPSHSYTFMHKDEFVKVSHPEKLGFTKNDRHLLNFVKNDVFNTIPDTSKIDELLQ